MDDLRADLASFSLVVTKAKRVMTDKLGQRIRIPEIASAISYSHTHLRRAFKAVTGESVIQHLTRMRVEKAQDMLTNSSMSITEIALETGFSSCTKLGVAMRRICGKSPRGFRSSARARMSGQSSEPFPFAERKETEWFADNFPGSFPGNWWSPQSGQWQVRHNALVGASLSSYQTNLLKPLPENFRVSLDLRHPERASDFVLILRDQDHSSSYSVFRLGAQGNSYGDLSCNGAVRQWSEKAVFKAGAWQRIELTLDDNHSTLTMDGEVIFSFADPFPPPYGSRCMLAVSGYQGNLEMRNLHVANLGFQAAHPPVRRGDSFYNLPLFDKAMEFYSRLLDSGPGPAMSVQLYYKIGMCLYSTGQFMRAREWLERVIGTPESKYWHRLARLALLEIDFREEGVGTLCEGVRKSFAEEEMRDGVREVMIRLSRNLAGKAFFEDSTKLTGLLADMEAKNSIPCLMAKVDHGRNLRMLRDYGASDAQLRDVMRHPVAPPRIQVLAGFILNDVLLCQGKFNASDKLLEELKELNKDYPMDFARADTYAALNLRGRGKLDEATSHFGGLAERHSAAMGWPAFGELEASLICCQTGDLSRARILLANACSEAPGKKNQRLGKSEYFYVPEFLDGRYAKAAEILGHDHARLKPGSMAYAHVGLKMAICLWLSGDAKAARDALATISTRCPKDQINFFGELAAQLAKRQTELVSQLPEEQRYRSEMFFLVARLCAHWGQKKRAKELLRMSANEDPTNRWPSWVAKKELGSV